MSFTLRPYQEKSISMLRESIAQHKHVVLTLPTGAGKTAISSHILDGAVKKGLRVGFIVNRLALVKQTSKVFSECEIDYGVHQGMNELEDDDKQVQICSIQTLQRRKHKPFDIIVIDEVHSLFKAHEALIEETPWVIGLTATPYRKGLGRLFNDLVIPVSMRDLIDDGYLADFDVYGPPTIDLAGLRKVAGEFVEEEVMERADTKKVTGAIVDHWKKHAAGRKTICFCINIAHGRHVARAFNKAGVRAVEVNSFQKADEGGERQGNMDLFTHGNAEVICSVDILGVGFDYPEVSCVIQARPTHSVTVHVQQCGRGLRIGGEERTIILDHVGNTERLGFVDTMEITELDGGSSARSTSKPKERAKPKPRACPSCEFMIPASILSCPACGVLCQHHEEIEETEEELMIMDRKKARKQTIAEKQKFMMSLNTYAHLKGMTPGKKRCYGWSIKAYKSRYGVLPSSKIQWAAMHPMYKVPDEDAAWIKVYQSKMFGSQNQPVVAQQTSLPFVNVRQQQSLPWSTTVATTQVS